jgi:hypothetical protein
VADPNQTPARGNWKCPCNGCKKAAKQAKEDILEFLHLSGYSEIALMLEEVKL